MKAIYNKTYFSKLLVNYNRNENSVSRNKYYYAYGMRLPKLI